MCWAVRDHCNDSLSLHQVTLASGELLLAQIMCCRSVFSSNKEALSSFSAGTICYFDNKLTTVVIFLNTKYFIVRFFPFFVLIFGTILSHLGLYSELITFLLLCYARTSSSPMTRSLHKRDMI